MKTQSVMLFLPLKQKLALTTTFLLEKSDTSRVGHRPLTCMLSSGGDGDKMLPDTSGSCLSPPGSTKDLACFFFFVV